MVIFVGQLYSDGVTFWEDSAGQYLQDGWGYDFRANMSVAWEEYGNYATDVFTREAVNVIEV